jgi:hypothetical protein
LVHAPDYSNYRVIRISLLWELNVNWDTFGEKWKNIVGISWEEWISQCRKVKTILIVDEAQLIYGKGKKVDDDNKESADQFWVVVKRLLQEVANINIIMFAAYGYRSTNNTGLTTPVTLPESHCKSLIDINFIPNELKTYVTRLSNRYFNNLDQQSVSNLYKYIQVITDTRGFGSSYLDVYSKCNEGANHC